MLSSLVGADVSSVFSQVGSGGNIDPNQMLETIKKIQPKDMGPSPQTRQSPATNAQPNFGDEDDGGDDDN